MVTIINREDKINVRRTYYIEFVMNTCDESKYTSRLTFFKEWGLLNVESSRVCLILLVGNSKINIELLQDWLIDIYVVYDKVDTPWGKYCSYLLRLTEYHIRNRKWYFKLDDDSITDVKYLITRLKKYNSEEKKYLCAGYIHDYCTDPVHILNKISFTKTQGITHEWEAAIISFSGVLEILSNEQSITYLKEYLSLNDSNGDWTWSIASLVAGITVEPCSFLTSWANIIDFSLFEGQYAHIHYVGPDFSNWTILKKILLDNINSTFINFSEKKKLVTKFIENDNVICKEDICNKNFKLFIDDFDVGLVLSFNMESCYFSHPTFEFISWELIKGAIVIRDIDNTIITILFKDLKNEIVGMSLKDMNINYKLISGNYYLKDNNYIMEPKLDFNVQQNCDRDERSELQILRYIFFTFKCDKIHLYGNLIDDSYSDILRKFFPTTKIKILSNKVSNKRNIIKEMGIIYIKDVVKDITPEYCNNLYKLVKKYKVVLLNIIVYKKEKISQLNESLIEGISNKDYILADTENKLIRSIVSPRCSFYYNGFILKKK